MILDPPAAPYGLVLPSLGFDEEPPERYHFLNTLGGILAVSGPRITFALTLVDPRGRPERLILLGIVGRQRRRHDVNSGGAVRSARPAAHKRRRIDAPLPSFWRLRVPRSRPLDLVPLRTQQRTRKDGLAAPSGCEQRNQPADFAIQLLLRVIQQEYEVNVHDGFATRGSTAVLTCQIQPAAAKDYTSVLSWLRDDKYLITSESQTQGKYALYPSGELYIHDVDERDAERSYRCQVLDHTTNATKANTRPARIILQGE
ncbi:hypothetical protein MTO96_006521 [Rhipicephalus appendiculatus]